MNFLYQTFFSLANPRPWHHFFLVLLGGGRSKRLTIGIKLLTRDLLKNLTLTILLPIRRSVLSSSCARSQSRRMFSLCSWLVYALSVKSCVLSITVSNAAVRVSRQPGPRRVILVVSTSLSKCFNAENAVLLSQSSCCGLWNQSSIQ